MESTVTVVGMIAFWADAIPDPAPAEGMIVIVSEVLKSAPEQFVSCSALVTVVTPTVSIKS